MGQTELFLEDAIKYAQQRGVKIVRRAVFSWVDNTNPYHTRATPYPVECNAIGAVLLKLGREDLVKEEFTPGWLRVIADYLGVDLFWLWRFCSGFDYGNELNLTHVKKQEDKKVETKETDKVSRYGNTLARRTCVISEGAVRSVRKVANG